MLTRLHDALRLRTSPVVFFGSAGLIVLFVLATLLLTEQMDALFAGGSAWLITNLGWFYVLGVTVFLLFLLYLAMSRFGQVRLGADDESPGHSNLSWFAMLFAAGIGTILMFWAVAEPVNHFANPPRQGVEPASMEAATEAMGFTLYHFGLHTWTIFTLPALAFGYFMYKRNLPPRVSSMFQPLLGEGIHGPVGRAIDILAIVGTLFGVAVSIGLGTMQINSGLARLFGVSESALSQILIITAVSIVASVSVALGLDKGIKRLSNTNILIAVGLLVFILLTGPTVMMLKGMVESAGTYLSMLPQLAFWNDTLADTGWQSGWTVFYWAWTITWSPFVGIFIARISRGRTIRQFVFGVLAFPTLFSVVWFGIFGMGVFDIELNGDGGLVEAVVDEGDIPGAMFEFLANFPLASITSAVGVLVVVLFFITSIDSAALVMDTMGSGHEEESPVHQRVFWVVAIGVIAAVLLTATGTRGLTALQNTAILIGLPFFVFGYLQIYSLLRALREDAGEVGVLTTRRWRKVLPPEEFQRRSEEGTLEDVVVVAPDYVHGTEPENAPEIAHPEQPDYVVEYHGTLGEDAELHVDEAQTVVSEGGTVVSEGGTVVATDGATVVAAEGTEVVPADEDPAVPGLEDTDVMPPREGAGEPR
ncbi:BCCT family transporter [uncultured Ornithinimicrobium sp.]|uniref:BCCT family transporter n=1 Tax=uncultured Ornithinimicrobium sp. TaxID=259307 RepID=UPI002599A1CD|nr:BCCT family transporter [uncultured Ornithinimicrobium sp.]